MKISHNVQNVGKHDFHRLAMFLCTMNRPLVLQLKELCLTHEATLTMVICLDGDVTVLHLVLFYMSLVIVKTSASSVISHSSTCVYRDCHG